MPIVSESPRRVAILDLDIPVYRCAISCEKESNWDSVKRSVDLYVHDWIQASGSTHYVGFLTDSMSNYRMTLAITWPYKGHRKAGERPRYYEAIREYMVEHWGAQIMVGIEADDALAVAHTHFESLGIESVIVTEDKDLLQVPALHYNVNKSSEVFRISEEQGFKNLWHQVITGDKTDNIPGVSQACQESLTGKWNDEIKQGDLTSAEKLKLYKRYPIQELYGPVSATKYLEEFPLMDWPMAVLQLYIDKYESEDYCCGRGTLRFEETFALIYMLRTEEEAMVYLNKTIDFKPLTAPVDPGIFDLFEDYG